MTQYQHCTTCKNLLLFLFFTTTLSAQDYQKAWELISTNDTKTAREYLEKAQKNAATATDAALTSWILESFEQVKPQEQISFDNARKTLSNPYPYYYALWLNKAVSGDYGLKSSTQVDFLVRN